LFYIYQFQPDDINNKFNMTAQSKMASSTASTPYSLTTLYIPRVHRNQMHESYVKRVLECQHIAVVSRVDFVEFEHPDANFCFAVVHILFWVPGVISKHFRERIQSQREARIVYSDPSYWVVLPYTQKQNVQKKEIRAEATLETYSTPPTPISSYTFGRPPFAPAPAPAPTKKYQDCICGCGGWEVDCSSQILYNTFTDSIWKTTTTTPPAESNWNNMGWNNMEENFRFYDHDTSSAQFAY
jgi:hypothetical protein